MTYFYLSHLCSYSIRRKKPAAEADWTNGDSASRGSFFPLNFPLTAARFAVEQCSTDINVARLSSQIRRPRLHGGSKILFLKSGPIATRIDEFANI